jgi:hypothetical protein
MVLDTKYPPDALNPVEKCAEFNVPLSCSITPCSLTPSRKVVEKQSPKIDGPPILSGAIEQERRYLREIYIVQWCCSVMNVHIIVRLIHHI